MISILLASRGRAWQLQRMVKSAFDHAQDPNNIEVIVITDSDDTSYDGVVFPVQYRVKLRAVTRTTLSHYWNIAYSIATGPIYMNCNDDVVFQTNDWDVDVEAAFNRYNDKIVLIGGDDGEATKKDHLPLFFLHKNWVDAIGYFLPPYFSSDFSDTWVNEVAASLGRREKINILTEHMHPAFGKGEQDLTYAERLVRHWKDDNAGLYAKKAGERLVDIEKLKAVMYV